VVTNIDREHLDHFGSEQALFTAFLDFAEKVPFYGLVVIGADNPAAARLAPLVSKRHTTYGLVAGDWRGEIIEAGPSGTRFRVRVHGKAHGEVACACRAFTTRATRWPRCAWPIFSASRSRPPARRWPASRASIAASPSAARSARC
jgi:hypothetical protein